MVISFERYHKKKLEKIAYRKQLVAIIYKHYRLQPESEKVDSFYLQHVKEGFPVHILEEIVRRLEKRASNT